MSSFPNILQPGESGLDDFPEETPARTSSRPFAPPLTFVEDLDLDPPANRVVITHARTPAPAVRRRRGVFAAAIMGVTAGALGGLLIFEPAAPEQPASLPFQPPASVDTVAQATPQSLPQSAPQSAARIDPAEADAPSADVRAPEVLPARPVPVTRPQAIAPPPRRLAPPPERTSERPVSVPPPAPASSPAPSSTPPPFLRTEQPAPPATIVQPPPAAARAEAPATEVGPAPAPAPDQVVEANRLEASPVPIASPKPANEQAAIDAVIGRYKAAYGNRDAAAVKRVWPSANQAALAKAFANLESQNLAFHDCRTTVEGSTARTSCEGQVSYVARVGDRSSRTQNRDWTFTLSRKSTDDDWQIDGVAIR